MVTGSQLGHIALWNLEEHKLQSQILEAHNGGITGMQCLPSEPLMVTSSPDNSLKVRRKNQHFPDAYSLIFFIVVNSKIFWVL